QLFGAPSTFEADFHRLDARFDHRLDSGNVRLATTLGIDRSANEQGSARSQLGGTRVELDQWLSRSFRLRTGSDVMFTHYDAGVPNGAPATQRAFDEVYPEHEDLVTGAYADVLLRPAPSVDLVPGVRADLYEWHRLGVRRSTLPSPTTLRPTSAVVA